MTYYTLPILASSYGANNYNSSSYGTSTATGTGSSTTGGGGTLSNTGVLVAGVVTLAAIILLVAMAVRVWKRPVKPEAVPVETDGPVDQGDVNR